MCGVLRRTHFDLTRSKFTLAITVSILLCLLPVQPAVSIDQPEFPIGLILEYDATQRLGINTIPLSSYSYEVIGWLGQNTILITITDSHGEHTVHVSLPQWHAAYENGTEYGYLNPLWMDISSWRENDNVSLGSRGVFELTGSRSVETDLGDFQCWTARQESSTSSYDLIQHYYYNHAHGLLVKIWRSYWYDTSTSTVNRVLVNSNIGDYDSIYMPQLFSSPFDLLIFGGIIIEILIIIHFIRTRHMKK